jgi:hypothetical protein
MMYQRKGEKRKITEQTEKENTVRNTEATPINNNLKSSETNSQPIHSQQQLSSTTQETVTEGHTSEQQEPPVKKQKSDVTLSM